MNNVFVTGGCPDGIVDSSDLLLLVQRFNQCLPLIAVPPYSMVILAYCDKIIAL